MTDLHQEAARIIHKFNAKEGFIKNLVYSSSYRNLRQLFALVSESIKYQEILQDIVTRTGSSLLSEELVGNDVVLAVVLLYEELIGAGFGRAGFVRKMMRQHKVEIKAAHDGFLKENNAGSLKDVLNGNSVERRDFPVLPRYVRVNRIKSSVQEAVDKLCQDGWEFMGKLNVDRFKEDVSSLGENQFGSDPLLDDVLVFPFNTDLHKDRLVTDGMLVLQERASCVPAHVLNPPPGSVVLDCCAAPGNKTSHLASLMGNQGSIIALDRDAKRVTTMRSMLQKTGSSCVEAIAQDFLTLAPDSPQVADITMILLDPSCSCTGMPTGTSYRQEVPLERLQSLKRYQISLLKHALRFPNVQRVVYSTCSTSRQENEEVVEEVMCKVRHHFNFATVLPDWPNSRGLKKFLHHTSFLRVSPEEHLTAGFFVACFEKIPKTAKANSDNSNGDSEKDANGNKIVPGHGDTESEVSADSDEKSLASEEYNTKKTKKKRKMGDEHIACEDTEAKVKKKRRKVKDDDNSEEGKENGIYSESRDEVHDDSENAKDTTGKKKKKKRQKNEVENEDIDVESDSETTSKKSKKKKRRKDKDDDNSEEGKENVIYSESRDEVHDDSENVKDTSRKKKKKKSQKEKVENENIDMQSDAETTSKKSKKKKKKTKKHSEDETT